MPKTYQQALLKFGLFAELEEKEAPQGMGEIEGEGGWILLRPQRSLVFRGLPSTGGGRGSTGHRLYLRGNLP